MLKRGLGNEVTRSTDDTETEEKQPAPPEEPIRGGLGMLCATSVMRLTAFLAAVAGVCLPTVGDALTGPMVYLQDFEGAVTDWILDPPWGVTTSDHASGAQQSHRQPGWPIQQRPHRCLCRSAIELQYRRCPFLRFGDRYNVESHAHFGYVEVSTDTELAPPFLHHRILGLVGHMLARKPIGGRVSGGRPGSKLWTIGACKLRCSFRPQGGALDG